MSERGRGNSNGLELEKEENDKARSGVCSIQSPKPKHFVNSIRAVFFRDLFSKTNCKVAPSCFVHAKRAPLIVNT